MDHVNPSHGKSGFKCRKREKKKSRLLVKSSKKEVMEWP